MGTTKIINVLKDERFEDLLTAFQKAPAEEVIFIFPKNAKLAKKEEHFALLAQSAADHQKQITIMTTDQKIETYAKKYGFKFLAQTVKSKKTNTRKKEEAENETINDGNSPEVDFVASPPIEPWNEELGDENENEEGRDSIPTDSVDSPPAELTMVRTRSGPKKAGPKSTDNKIKKLESIWLKRESSDQVYSKSSKTRRGLSRQHFNIIFLSSAVLILLFVLFAFLGSAQVIIKPQKQKLDFELPITVSTNAVEVDTASNTLPGQLLSFKAEASNDFPVTGEEEVVKKARGEITIYNNFNSDPQNLVATTRFESSKGLIFRIPRPIAIPGAKLINGKLTPGSITVEVIADKPGQAYNINADRFTIPGFAGTPKFEGFYAQSSKPISGGLVGLSKIVAEKDFNSAKETITKEVLDKALENLKAQTSNLQIVEPVNNEIISLKSTAEIDDVAEGLAMSATAEAKTIAFVKENLLTTIEGFINKNGNLILLKEGINIDYQNIKFDFAKNNLTFTIVVKGEAAAKIDEENIITGLLGLKQNEIKEYFLKFEEIESARIILSPFWVKTVPKNKQDVQVKLVY